MTPEDTSPLGKSVEEVEQESSNRTNSSVTGENRDTDDVGILPAVAPVGGVAGSGVSSGVPAVVVNPGLLTDASESGADDGRNNKDRDSSEE
jgi:hypothetical protein